MSRPLPALLLLLLHLIILPILLCPLRAEAQPVLGIVVEEGTGRPVMGAMVMLFDEGGDRVDRMLTNVAGRFALDARAPGPTTSRREDRLRHADHRSLRRGPRRPLPHHRRPDRAGRAHRPGCGERAPLRGEARRGRVTAAVWDEVRKARRPRRGRARPPCTATRWSAFRGPWTGRATTCSRTRRASPRTGSGLRVGTDRTARRRGVRAGGGRFRHHLLRTRRGGTDLGCVPGHALHEGAGRRRWPPRAHLRADPRTPGSGTSPASSGWTRRPASWTGWSTATGT